MSCRFPLDSFRALVATAVLLLLPMSAKALDDVPDEDEAPAPPEPAPAKPEPPPAEPAPEPAAPATEDVALPPADAPPAEAATDTDRPLSGYWHGRSRLQLVVGQHFGNTVRDAGILATPITGQPGSRLYPALTPLQVDLEDSPVFGLRYAWFASEKWGFEVGLEQVSSKIVDPDSDLVADEARILRSNLLPETLKALLLARLKAHQAEHDMDVTFVDIGAIHVFNPRKRWPIEIGGGIGYASPSMDGRVAYERLVTSDILIDRPQDPLSVGNDVVDPAPPFGQCLADNDPCIELKAKGGLTWHAMLGIGYAFTPAVQLRFGTKLRLIENLVDPGDTNVMSEVTMGLSFQFGGQ